MNNNDWIYVVISTRNAILIGFITPEHEPTTVEEQKTEPKPEKNA